MPTKCTICNAVLDARRTRATCRACDAIFARIRGMHGVTPAEVTTRVAEYARRAAAGEPLFPGCRPGRAWGVAS